MLRFQYFASAKAVERLMIAAGLTLHIQRVCAGSRSEGGRWRSDGRLDPQAQCQVSSETQAARQTTGLSLAETRQERLVAKGATLTEHYHQCPSRNNHVSKNAVRLRRHEQWIGAARTANRNNSLRVVCMWEDG